MYITANDLKTRGATAIAENIEEDSGLSVLVRGQRKYVILDTEYYDRLREYELIMAVKKSKADIAAGQFTTSIDEHLKTLQNAI